jgi:5-methyltetrahydropteroyltriglutamate--homocysteine methyltransferase
MRGTRCSISISQRPDLFTEEGKPGRKTQKDIKAADVQDLSVETSHIIAERITKLGWLPPDQTMITSSCGLSHLERRIAFGKLRAMAEAKQVLLRR